MYVYLIFRFQIRQSTNPCCNRCCCTWSW